MERTGRGDQPARQRGLCRSDSWPKRAEVLPRAPITKPSPPRKARMKAIIHILRPPSLTVLMSISLMTSAKAQTVIVPDPGLNAAIRDALRKPAGPLTDQD